MRSLACKQQRAGSRRSQGWRRRQGRKVSMRVAKATEQAAATWRREEEEARIGRSNVGEKASGDVIFYRDASGAGWSVNPLDKPALRARQSPQLNPHR